MGCFKKFYRSLLFVSSLIFLAGSQTVGMEHDGLLMSGFVSSAKIEQGLIAELNLDDQAVKSSLGLIVSVKGKVKIEAADGSFRPGKTKGALYQGDQIFTGKRSSFQGVFADGSTMRLASNSDLIINEYYWREAEGEAKADFSVENGTLAFLASKISKVAPQNYKIHTATATVGIRGSAGELKVRSGGEEEPFTQARVSPGGHVLEISSSQGVFVLDDPTRALEIKTDSVAWFPVTADDPWVGDSEDDEEEEDSEEESDEEEEASEEEAEEEDEEEELEDEEEELEEEAESDEEMEEEVEEEAEADSEVKEEPLADEELLEEEDDAEDLVVNAMETEDTEAEVLEVSDNDTDSWGEQKQAEKKVDGERIKVDKKDEVDEGELVTAQFSKKKGEGDDGDSPSDGSPDGDRQLAKAEKSEEREAPKVKEEKGSAKAPKAAKAPKTLKAPKKIEVDSVEVEIPVVEIEVPVVEVEVPVVVIEIPSVADIVESVQEQVQNETSEEANTVAVQSAADEAGITLSSSSAPSLGSSYDYLGKTSAIDNSLQMDIDSATYPLPSFWVPSTQQYTQVSDVTWGKDSSKSVSATDGLKIGDYWIEGTLTTVGSSGNVQTKLGVPDQYAYYTGLTVQTLQKAEGTSSEEIGLSVTGIDYSSKRFSSLAFFPEQGAVIIAEDNNVVETSGFDVDLTLYSLSGGNVDKHEDGLFFSESKGPSGVSGKFAGTGAKTIFSKYDRSYSSSQFSQAVDISERTSSTESITANTQLQVDGSSSGVVIASDGAATMIPESEASNTLGVEGNSNFSLSIDKSGGKNYLGPIEVKAKDVEVFISKDAFFTTLDKEGNISNYLNITSLDEDNSYLAGVPGLNDFDYIGWGIWSVQESGGASQRLYGYTAFGKNDQLTPSVDISTLKGSGDSNVVIYKGPAMGSVFNSGETPTIQFGTTVMNVDFGTGGVSGAVTFSADTIQMTRSAGTDIGSSFSGSATLNNGGSGYFTGQFFGSQAKEAAGTFGATNGSRVAVGAYGVKK